MHDMCLFVTTAAGWHGGLRPPARLCAAFEACKRPSVPPNSSLRHRPQKRECDGRDLPPEKAFLANLKVSLDVKRLPTRLRFELCGVWAEVAFTPATLSEDG